MRERRTVSDQQIAKVKELHALKFGSLYDIAFAVGISYYSVWHIVKGTYDDPDSRLDKVFKKESELVTHF